MIALSWILVELVGNGEVLETLIHLQITLRLVVLKYAAGRVTHCLILTSQGFLCSDNPSVVRGLEVGLEPLCLSK